MNAVVVGFRPFKIPRPTNSQWAEVDNTKNEQFMFADLEKSGLVPDDLEAYATGFYRRDGALACYAIPYYGLDGKILADRENYPAMFRVRYKYPEFSKEQRYSQPSGASLEKHGLPPNVPYIPPQIHKIEGDTLVICEGEKKCLSVIKHLDIPAIGIGGCNNWGDPDKSGGLHPWIVGIIRKRNVKRVLLIPDGDVKRYHISRAYGTLAATLIALPCEVEIINPEDKIDDWITRHISSGADLRQSFSCLERLDPRSLVESHGSLAAKYDLATRPSTKGSVSIEQTTSNVTILLERHPAFGEKFWLNQDTNRMMIGERECKPDHTEMEIVNYCQHNFSMPKVNPNLVRGVMKYLAHDNARSPMLDWIKELVWDGEKRLDYWLQTHWGVTDSEFVREVASKWLISACARMDKPGTKLDWMLIVIGPQRTGKTSMPGILFKGNALTLYGEHNDKDLHLLLHSALCVGFDELDSFGKRESSNLKAMITRNEDRFRPPYGAVNEIFPRRFTLYGCGNKYEFLQNDPSGYRRYAVIEVEKLLDFRGLEGVVEQLWAEAWERYKGGGVDYWEVEGASREAEKYAAPNPLEDQIIGWIEAQKFNKSNSAVKDGVFYFTMHQLMGGLGMEREIRNNTVTRDISGLLVKYGCARNPPTRKMVAPGVTGRYYSLKIE